MLDVADASSLLKTSTLDFFFISERPHNMFLDPRKWWPNQSDSLKSNKDLIHKDLSVEKLGMLIHSHFVNISSFIFPVQIIVLCPRRIT